MLSWQSNSTLHFTSLMQLSQHRLQNFRPNASLPTLSIISWLSTKLKILPKCLKTFFCCILKQSSFHNLTLFTPQHSTLLTAYLYQKDKRAQPQNFRTLLPPIIKVFILPLYFMFFFTVWSVFNLKSQGKKAGWKELEEESTPATPKETIPTRSLPCALTKEPTGARENDDIGVSLLTKVEWATNTEIKCRLFRFLTRIAVEQDSIWSALMDLPLRVIFDLERLKSVEIEHPSRSHITFRRDELKKLRLHQTLTTHRVIHDVYVYSSRIWLKANYSSRFVP
jgi:hypothetical protein